MSFSILELRLASFSTRSDENIIWMKIFTLRPYSRSRFRFPNDEISMNRFRVMPCRHSMCPPRQERRNSVTLSTAVCSEGSSQRHQSRQTDCHQAELASQPASQPASIVLFVFFRCSLLRWRITNSHVVVVAAALCFFMASVVGRGYTLSIRLFVSSFLPSFVRSVAGGYVRPPVYRFASSPRRASRSGG